MKTYLPVGFLLASLLAGGCAPSAHAHFLQRGSFISRVTLTTDISMQHHTNINPCGTFSVDAMFTSGGVQFAGGGVSEEPHDNGIYVNRADVQ